MNNMVGLIFEMQRLCLDGMKRRFINEEKREEKKEEIKDLCFLGGKEDLLT